LHPLETNTSRMSVIAGLVVRDSLIDNPKLLILSLARVVGTNRHMSLGGGLVWVCIAAAPWPEVICCSTETGRTAMDWDSGHPTAIIVSRPHDLTP
jgi:hypothetical protein